MPKYVLDTNIYIRATRDWQFKEELKQFLAANAPWIYLHAVVAHELLAGAVTDELKSDTRTHLLEPIERRGRLLTPSFSAWKSGADVIAHLIQWKRLSPGGVSRSFPNDCLIAASAREHGFTLITTNEEDFALIAEVLPFQFVPPWPAPGL